MADQAFTSTDPNSMTPPSQGFDKTAGAAKSVADQALSAGRDLKERAMDAAGASSEAIKDKASGNQNDRQHDPYSLLHPLD